MNATNLPLVMMIDDNEIDLFVNKKFLRASGITDNMLAFSSAREALDYLVENAGIPLKLPKFILLDIQMPGINGFQFLEMLQSVPEQVKSAIKVVMLSSTLDPSDIDRARNNQFVIDIMKKPIDPIGLKSLLAA
jgi:CheY-like chemotaxis protein